MMMDEVTTRLQQPVSASASAAAAPDYVVEASSSCQPLERHLMADCETTGTHIHTAHAATNTTGLAHLAAAADSSASGARLSGQQLRPSSMGELQQQQQQQQHPPLVKKKRGPKAGRKAALAAAAAAAAAAAGHAHPQLATNSTADPYVFHCDSLEHPKVASCYQQQQQQQHPHQQQQQLALNDHRLQSDSSTRNKKLQREQRQQQQQQQQQQLTAPLHYGEHQAHESAASEHQALIGQQQQHISSARIISSTSNHYNTSTNPTSNSNYSSQASLSESIQTTILQDGRLNFNCSSSSSSSSNRQFQDSSELKQFKLNNNNNSNHNNHKNNSPQASNFNSTQNSQMIAHKQQQQHLVPPVRTTAQQMSNQQQQQQQHHHQHQHQQIHHQMNQTSQQMQQPAEFYNDPTVEQQYTIEAPQVVSAGYQTTAQSGERFGPRPPSQMRHNIYPQEHQHHQVPPPQQQQAMHPHNQQQQQQAQVAYQQQQQQSFGDTQQQVVAQTNVIGQRPIGSVRQPHPQQQQQRVSPYPAPQTVRSSPNQSSQPPQISRQQVFSASGQQQYNGKARLQIPQQQLISPNANNSTLYPQSQSQQQQPQYQHQQFLDNGEQVSAQQAQQCKQPVIVHYKPQAGSSSLEQPHQQQLTRTTIHPQQQQHSHYPANSPPTLLQQQLNRQQQPQQQQMQLQMQNPQHRLPPHHQQQQQQQVQAQISGVSQRYKTTAGVMSGQRASQQSMLLSEPVAAPFNPNESVATPPLVRTTRPEQYQQHDPNHHHHQHLYQQQPRAIVQQQQQQPPPVHSIQRNQRQLLENPQPPHHTHHPHLLGNPTPPLTPTTTTLAPPPIGMGHSRMNQMGVGSQQPPQVVVGGAMESSQQQWHQSSGPIEGAGPMPLGYPSNRPQPQPQMSQQRIIPKTFVQQQQQQQPQANHQYHPQHHHQSQPPTSQVPCSAGPQQVIAAGAANIQTSAPHPPQQQLEGPVRSSGVGGAIVTTTHEHATRLTLPLGGAPILAPFKLAHDAQFTSKVFHLKSQLFETLSKSMSLANPHTATVIHELQFRAYLTNQIDSKSHNSSTAGDSLLASNHHVSNNKECNWPELFQLSVNQNVVHLDRGLQASNGAKVPPSASPLGQHKAADIFQLCLLGDNILDIQVNNCYCSHEFVLEAVERPTLKAFMNSCFKSRMLSVEACLQKMKFNFGLPGFLIQQQHGIFNEYISEFNPQMGVEQTKTKISLRCSITNRRMRTPTRGHNCKHLQCFDLESFLFMNRERSQWSCPICPLSIPFNMLELDQHQINIIQSMSDILNTDEILIDSSTGSGQWQAYYSSPTPAQINGSSQNHHNHQHSTSQMHLQTAKANGTYHPQAPPPSAMLANGSNTASPIPSNHHNHQHYQQQPMRPMSGPVMQSVNPQPRPASNISVPNSSPASHHWDSPQHPTSASTSSELIVQQQQPISRGRRSANGSPLAKKPYAGQYSQQPYQQSQQQQQQQHQLPPSSVQNQASSVFYDAHSNQSTHSSISNPTSSFTDNPDDISPLAAMERTVIQHQQQMGPPPFDANALTSSSPLRTSNSSSSSSTTTTSTTTTTTTANQAISSQQPQSNTAHQQMPNSNQQQQQQHIPPPQATGTVSSPESRVQQTNAGYSPLHQNAAVSSPANSGRAVAVGVTVGEIPPQSPMQQQQQQQQQTQITSISTPATPSSSSILIHGGPETPATPGNQQQHCGPNSVSGLSHTTSPHVSSASNSNGALHSQVDHQPLSNGSASAGSITSTSTMTPSGQSLGSVGMGGDSRCGTAPLQHGPLGLDDLLGGGTSSSSVSSHMLSSQSSQTLGSAGNSLGGQGSPYVKGQSSIQLDDKNDILLGKLMMDSVDGASMLHPTNNATDLALALEEAEWKQQLDSSRGKSEHLANFLNEPLMNKQHLSHHHHYQTPGQNSSMINNNNQNKMISGGLNPSDDEGVNHSHNSSPAHNIDQLEFVNYLDSEGADNGAGLPPDDSILDLFER